MSNAIAQDYIRELAMALRLGGTDGGLIRASDPTAEPFPVRFLLSHPNRRDEAIVNAYGINALVLTIPASAQLVAEPPVKFDLIVFNLNTLPGGSKPYSLDSVLMRQVANTPVAFTCYVKGKGE